MPFAPKTLRPAGAPSRDEQRRRYDRERGERQHWRKWYSLAIWGRIRREQLAREPLCQRCKARDEVEPATEVHHVAPHRGVWERFIGGPFESLCKPCHDGEAQADERSR